jgi:hypothetical protein
MKLKPENSIFGRLCLLLIIFGFVFPLGVAAETLTPIKNKKITATHGEVVVHSRDIHGGELYAIVKAFKPGTPTEVAGSGSAHAELELPAGIYDIEVYYDALLQSKWLRGITVNPETRQEITVTFDFGTVDVHVLDPDGNEHYSAVTAYKPGTDEKIAGHSSARARLILPVGTYDIEVYSMDLYTSVWLKGLRVVNGGRIERTVQFSDGEMSSDSVENADSREDIGTEDNAEIPPVIRTALLQMTGLSDEDRIIITDTLQMTGITNENRIIRTETLQMTGLTYEDRIINTEILTMTGLNE